MPDPFGLVGSRYSRQEFELRARWIFLRGPHWIHHSGAFCDKKSRGTCNIKVADSRLKKQCTCTKAVPSMAGSSLVTDVKIKLFVVALAYGMWLIFSSAWTNFLNHLLAFKFVLCVKSRLKVHILHLRQHIILFYMAENCVPLNESTSHIP